MFVHLVSLASAQTLNLYPRWIAGAIAIALFNKVNDFLDLGVHRRDCPAAAPRLAVQPHHAHHGSWNPHLLQPRGCDLLALRGCSRGLHSRHPAHRSNLHLRLSVLVHATGPRQEGLPGKKICFMTVSYHILEFSQGLVEIGLNYSKAPNV